MKRLRAEGRRAVDEKVIFETVLERRHIVETSRKTARTLREAKKLPHVKSSVTEIQPESDLDYSKLTPFEVEEWQ